ncbi:NEP1-interacting protein 2 [Linum perenne]
MLSLAPTCSSSYKYSSQFPPPTNKLTQSLSHSEEKRSKMIGRWLRAATCLWSVEGLFLSLLTNILLASLTCIIALGGAVVGTIVGAMKGQTTETGFMRGSVIGAVSGAITSLQLLESFSDGEQLSKVALLNSLVSGKVFMEWVGPAVLKAYQFQMRAIESTYREMADIYDTNGVTGLPEHCIQSIPQLTFQIQQPTSCQCNTYHLLSCSICLQDFEQGELMRQVPSCGHYFHSDCLDNWLIRNASCPMCRTYVCNDNFEL